jgi:hypothetical protein
LILTCLHETGFKGQKFKQFFSARLAGKEAANEKAFGRLIEK